MYPKQVKQNLPRNPPEFGLGTRRTCSSRGLTGAVTLPYRGTIRANYRDEYLLNLHQYKYNTQNSHTCLKLDSEGRLEGEAALKVSKTGGFTLLEDGVAESPVVLGILVGTSCGFNYLILRHIRLSLFTCERSWR
ncbi:hypothetical protein B0H19DRAFT_1243469, partial [Mycena capillaripes]